MTDIQINWEEWMRKQCIHIPQNDSEMKKAEESLIRKREGTREKHDYR